MNRQWFLDHGVNIFPITAGAKRPDVGPNSWKGWTRPVTTKAYGVELGSLLVVDGDNPNTAAWILANVPPTPFVVTTGPYHNPAHVGRGAHHYFRSPANLTPAFIQRDGLAIEVRRLGQYVLGPGSVHPSGCTYDAADWSWRWDDLPIFPADFAFFDGTGTTSAPGAPYEVPDTVGEGQRTHELYRFLRHLKAHRCDLEMAKFGVWQFNLSRCTPPKSESWFRGWFGRSWNHPDQPGFNQGSWLDVVDPAVGAQLEEAPSVDQLERF